MAYLSEFRELYDGLHDAKSWQVAPLLYDWSSRNAAILEPLRKFQQFNALDNSYEIASGELESLYALSRVCDTLILPFQAGQCWFNLSPMQFAEFWQTLGLAARETDDYHPFWCEIVACENGDDDDAPPLIEEVFWPALTWGDLLICRAGVKVEAGRNWMDAAVAAGSPLYFASRRNYRKAHDLSHGWGSNSQWSTSFRRDYVWGEHYIFNADGSPDLDKSPFIRDLSAHQWAELEPRHFFASDFYRWESGEPGSTVPERESLLVNRCLIDGEVTDAEFWPWDDVAIWHRSAPLLPLS